VESFSFGNEDDYHGSEVGIAAEPIQAGNTKSKKADCP
jgi:hypothetical protein